MSYTPPHSQPSARRISWRALPRHHKGFTRQDIFLDGEEGQRFLGLLTHIVSQFHLLLRAFCVMDNHLHLVVETPDANLARATGNSRCLCPGLQPLSRSG